MWSKEAQTIEFAVTEKHIKEGRFGASNCPVALAINEAVGGQFALVGWHSTSIYWGDTKKITNNYIKPTPVIYINSKETKAAIESYDKYYGMKPFVGRITRESR